MSIEWYKHDIHMQGFLYALWKLQLHDGSGVEISYGHLRMVDDVVSGRINEKTIEEA